jgi:small subunit ribosomal protein S9
MPKRTVKKKPKKEKIKKERKPKATKPEVEKKEAPSKERYFEANGRRKTSIARIRLFTKGDKTSLVNGKPYDKYFPTLELKQIFLSALEKMNCLDRFGIEANVKGGGLHSQAEAVRHGIARALVLFNPEFKKRLKKAGFLTRDPRMRERKKFGLKRARRAPQWAKR